MQTIPITKNDPLESAEIMFLVGLDGAKLSVPRVSAQLQDIVKYFRNSPDKRYQILKVVMKTGDKLDNLWTYVQLQKEKAQKFELLNPEDFEPDIVEEIISGHLTMQAKERIRKDIQQRMADSPDEKLETYSKTLDELDLIDSQL